jgi:hypothetical protein
MSDTKTGTADTKFPLPVEPREFPRSATLLDRVSLPKRITALRADRRQFFIEADGQPGEYVAADCAYEARAKYIATLINKQSAY